MALGFLKKVFSFGKKEVEDVPAEGEAAARPDEDSARSAETTPSPPPGPDPVPGEEDTAPEEAHFDAPRVPEFLRRPEAGEDREPDPVTWDAPESEDRTAPERSTDEEPSDPGPVPETPVETPDAPREEPPEPVGREIREEAERTPRSTPAPEAESVPDSKPEEAEPEGTPAKPGAESDGEEKRAVETPPEPPVETPDAPQANDVETEDATGEPESAPDPDEKGAAETVPPPAAASPPPTPTPSTASADGRVSVGRSVERGAGKAPEPAPTEQKKPWFQRLREGLSRSSRELSGSISGILTKRKLDEDTLQDLEDVLLQADLGLETAMRVTDSLSSGRYGRDVSDAEVRGVMAAEIEKVLEPVAMPLELDLSHKPHVILVVGVNGTGKTTTIGKLAAKLKDGGLSVMIAAGDTFRAAAIEQLRIWGERTDSPVIASKLGADAAGLAWDAYAKAKEAGSDVLVIDTAGRLQNKAELMAELEKIVRVLGKHDPEAPHTVLQTVDATTGQNALNQVEIFKNVAGVNGLVMTKLDGTARGGILVAIAAKHKLPVYFVGVGEQVDDFEPFSAGDFAKAIAGVD